MVDQRALVHMNVTRNISKPVQRTVMASFVELYDDGSHSSIDVVSAVGGGRLIVADGEERPIAEARLTGASAGGTAHRVGCPNVDGADERFVDENDGDEHDEALLGEAGDVADERAEVERHCRQQKDRHPDADPQTKRQKVDTVLSTRSTCRIMHG